MNHDDFQRLFPCKRYPVHQWRLVNTSNEWCSTSPNTPTMIGPTYQQFACDCGERRTEGGRWNDWGDADA